MNKGDNRRRFLRRTASMACLAAASPGMAFALADGRRRLPGPGGLSGIPERDSGVDRLAVEGDSVALGAGTVRLLSDGNMSLPVDMLFPASLTPPDVDREAVLATLGMSDGGLARPLNVTLWEAGDRRILFDVGSGMNFLPGTGELPAALDAAGIDPASITDVVFTHAHPDHIWGLQDDFDDLLFPDANYYLHEREFAFWSDDQTVASMPEERKTFAVGARNRLDLLGDRIQLFGWGREVLPGVEAVDTHGHTPGHTSFVLHEGDESLVVLGDALTDALVSFEYPRWQSGTDQDRSVAVETRLRLLDRLAGDDMPVIGYHLPAPGVGRVERAGGAYRYVEV